jgi:hypothetical protein
LPPIEKTLGVSLRPQIGGAKRPERVVPSFRHDSAAIRKDAFRFIRYGDGSTQLFDLKTDLWNLRDLGPEHPAHEGMQNALVETCQLYDMPLSDGATERG